MLTSNINFQNFKLKKINKLKKKLSKIVKSEILISKYPLLKSLQPNYIYSFKKKKLRYLKKFPEYNLIGMGGSVLGAEAIYSFLKHKINKKFNFYNNISNSKISKSKKRYLNIVISKSGNTLETFTNLNLVLSNQKKNDNLIITQNDDSIIRKLAYRIKADVVEHKNYIGGRYSVLSEVGMLPAELMGLNEKKFKKYNYLLKKKTFINHLIDNVIFIRKLMISGKKNSVILNYDQKSENFFKWYQQLTAESLGKKGFGIFPIISTMPKDNHSLLQLYLDGPKDKFYTFFSVREKNSHNYSKSFLVDDYKKLVNKDVDKVLHAQKYATQNIFRKKKLHFRTFEIFNRNEETLGELFCFFILETLLLGELLNINPLNQPSVELIKTETKKILK